MNDILQQIHDIGIVPVIAIDDAADAVPLAHALTKGGLPAAEVTFRTAAGEAAIKAISTECPDMLVGAGTVLNVEQCDRAIAAGSRFIVSPGYNPDVVNYCIKRDIPVLPGCADASQMTQAVNAGLRVVKFFPAETLGGLAAIKALAPVFPTLSFMPTGGVNTDNMPQYLGYNRILACGGTWMVKKDLINGHRWDEITRICTEAVDRMLGFSIRHIGINSTEEGAAEIAQGFCKLLGLEYLPGGSSDFSGTLIETMKHAKHGRYGHIAINTNNIERAMWRLTQRGATWDDESRAYNDAGALKFIYLNEEIGGFAVHLNLK